MLDPNLPVEAQNPAEFWDPWYYLQHQTVRGISGIQKWQPWSHLRILCAGVTRCYREGKWLNHLKARREGSTATLVGIGYQNAAHRTGCTSAFLGFKKESALSMAKIAVRYWQHEPEAWRPKRRPGLKRLLAFDQLDSEIVVAAVKDDEPLRGEGIQFTLANELSSWQSNKAQDVWVAVRSAVAEHHGLLVVDSTGRYAGDPASLVWKEGKEPGSPWLNLFIPWTLIERYSLEPPPKWEPHPLVRYYLDTHPGITEAQAYWMHKVGLPKCKYDLAKFMAEYPYDELEPFQVSGECLFDAIQLTARLRQLDQGTGLLRELSEYEEFYAPVPGHHYVVACDPASSFAEKDFFGVVVMDVTTCEVVAEYVGHKKAFIMARLLIELSSRYNHGNIYVEANGVGEGVLSHLDAMGYRHVFWRRDITSSRPKPGWWSNVAHKAQALGIAQELVQDGSIILHSRRLIEQILGYRGGWESSRRDLQGGHFDLFAAFCIACWAYMAELGRGHQKVKTKQALEQEALDNFNRALETLAPSSMPGGTMTPWGMHK